MDMTSKLGGRKGSDACQISFLLFYSRFIGIGVLPERGKAVLVILVIRWKASFVVLLNVEDNFVT